MEAERDVVRPGAATKGPLTTLRADLGHEREWVRYWSELAADSDDNGDPAA